MKAALTLFAKLVALTIIFIGLYAIVVSIGPAAEARRWPVVGKLTNITFEQISPDETEIRGEFRKFRDCEYVGIAWFVGNPDGDFRRITVQTFPQENGLVSPTRPVGTQTVGPWIVGASLEDVKNNSFAILRHRCHPFWLTETSFYP